MATNTADSPDHQSKQSLSSTTTLQAAFQPTRFGPNQPLPRTQCSTETASAVSSDPAARMLTLAVLAVLADPPLADRTPLATLADPPIHTILASPNATVAPAPSLSNGLLSSATSTPAGTMLPSSCFSRWMRWRSVVSLSWRPTSTCPLLEKSLYFSAVLLVSLIAMF